MAEVVRGGKAEMDGYARSKGQRRLVSLASIVRKDGQRDGVEHR